MGFFYDDFKKSSGKTSKHGIDVERSSMQQVTWLRSLVVLVFVTLVAFVEVSVRGPWWPLLLAYGLMIIGAPLLLANRRELGFVWPLSVSEAVGTVAIFFVLYFAFQSIAGYAYQLYLASLRGLPPVTVDLLAAQQTAVQVSATRAAEVISSAAPTTASTILSLIPWVTLVYAPVGEELFYRGFGYAQLAQRAPFLVSGTISSVLFGVRHTIQLLVVTPTPWVAGLYWFGLTLPFGYLACYLFKRTSSLYPVMALHFFVNLVSALPP